MQHPLLIDCSTLQQRLGQPGLVIIDVRGRAAYEFGGHIPGAVHSTWHEYSDPEAVAKGLLDPDLKRIEKRLRSLGINQDSEVVIYSNPFDNWGDEGRMFWMLEYLGHKNLKVLDGGWVTGKRRRLRQGISQRCRQLFIERHFPLIDGKAIGIVCHQAVLGL